MHIAQKSYNWSSHKFYSLHIIIIIVIINIIILIIIIWEVPFKKKNLFERWLLYTLLIGFQLPRSFLLCSGHKSLYFFSMETICKPTALNCRKKSNTETKRICRDI